MVINGTFLIKEVEGLELEERVVAINRVTKVVKKVVETLDLVLLVVWDGVLLLKKGQKFLKPQRRYKTLRNMQLERHL